MALVDRWYKILNILEINSNISQNALKDSLGTSRQTLKKNIQLLNKELKGIARITLDNHQYSLSIIQFDEYEKIVSGKLKKESDFNSSSKRIAYILKRLIEYDAPITINDLSEELSVSRGTVTNDINSIRDFIQLYEVKIIGVTNKGLVISGSELNLRLLYINVVLDYFPIEKVNEVTKQKILSKCRDLKVPKQSINLLIRVVETTFMRIAQGHNLINEIKYYQNFISNTNIFEQFIIFLEEEYDITLSSNESDFICFPFNIYNQGNEPQKEYDFDISAYIFSAMMKKIHGLFIIEFDEKNLYEEIKVHLSHLINRLLMRIKAKDLFSIQLEAKYPLSNAMAKVAGQVIEKLIGRPVPDVEISYLTLYFEMALNRGSDSSNKDIAVICHTGRGTAKMIKQQLQRVLGNNVTISVYSQNEINNELLEKYFAIFTTIPLRNDAATTPVIQLSTIFDDNYVREQWERVEKNKSIDSAYIELLVTNLDGTLNYKEHLKKMTDTLEQHLLTDPDFVKRIFEREEIKSTVFDNGVAMPHAINKKSNKVVLNIGKFETPFLVGSKEVELVFMIGIPEDAPAVIENVLLEVYEFFFVVVNTHEIKEKLLNAKDNAEVKELIRKEVI